MFKNTQDFKKAKLVCMEAILKHNDDFRNSVSIDPIELYDVLILLRDEKLVQGLHTLELNPNGELLVTSSSLRLSYRGLHEYEETTPHSTWGEK